LQKWLDTSEVQRLNQDLAMSSDRQITANRANAKRSTGPKTIVGKIRSSRNALKHGLSASAFLQIDGTDAVSKSLIEKSPINSFHQELMRAERNRCYRE
jgi:hypothetical protein